MNRDRPAGPSTASVLVGPGTGGRSSGRVPAVHTPAAGRGGRAHSTARRAPEGTAVNEWVYGNCKSINRAAAGSCYSCGGPKSAVAAPDPRLASAPPQPADQSAPIAGSPPVGANAAVAAGPFGVPNVAGPMVDMVPPTPASMSDGSSLPRPRPRLPPPNRRAAPGTRPRPMDGGSASSSSPGRTRRH